MVTKSNIRHAYYYMLFNSITTLITLLLKIKQRYVNQNLRKNGHKS